MDKRYPNLNFKELYPILDLVHNIAKDPLYLEESTYDEATRESLLNLALKKEGVSTVKLSDLDLEEETVRLYQSMVRISTNVNDPKEEIALIKLKANILKELLDMLKEAKRYKNIRQFQETVFNILTEEQKEAILELTV